MSLPTLAILYQDAHDGRHVTSYVINVRANTKAAGTIARTTVEPGANLLVPVNAPYKGLVVIGEQSIVYLQPMNNPITTYMEATVIKAQVFIILLSDTTIAYLYLYFVQQVWDNWFHTNTTRRSSRSPVCFDSVNWQSRRRGITSRKAWSGMEKDGLHKRFSQSINLIKTFWQISSPTSLSYLNDGMLFVGSAYGDSQLVQLNTEKNDEGDYVNILDEMPNLGPITDFAVVDLEKQGQVR
jgi:DNA damage-binding protein 1